MGYADNPLGFCSFHPEVLGPVWEGEQGRERRIPAACVADGEGKGARELEGTTAHLQVASGWLGVAYGGGSACSGGWWWSEMAEAALR